MKTKISLTIFFGFLILVAIALIECDQNGDNNNDGDSDGNNNNGWSESDCGYVYDGSQVQSGNLSSSKPKEGFEDCVPEPPDDVDPEPIYAILEVHLGTYVVDGNGAERIFTCRPEGIWVVPGDYNPEAICDYFWSIPIWITLSEDGTAIESAIVQTGYQLEDLSDPTSWPGATLDIGYVGYTEDAIRQWGPGNVLQWVIYYPEEWKGQVWTKVD